jgi:hypothetical protein
VFGGFGKPLNSFTFVFDGADTDFREISVERIAMNEVSIYSLACKYSAT